MLRHSQPRRDPGCPMLQGPRQSWEGRLWRERCHPPRSERPAPQRMGWRPAARPARGRALRGGPAERAGACAPQPRTPAQPCGSGAPPAGGSCAPRRTALPQIPSRVMAATAASGNGPTQDPRIKLPTAGRARHAGYHCSPLPIWPPARGSRRPVRLCATQRGPTAPINAKPKRNEARGVPREPGSATAGRARARAGARLRDAPGLVRGGLRPRGRQLRVQLAAQLLARRERSAEGRRRRRSAAAAAAAVAGAGRAVRQVGRAVARLELRRGPRGHLGGARALSGGREQTGLSLKPCCLQN